MSGRLEGRINRSREYHESLINTMRNEQIKFQSKVRSTLTNLQSFHVLAPEQVDASVNHIRPALENIGVTPLGKMEMKEGFGGSIAGGRDLAEVQVELMVVMVALGARVEVLGTGGIENWICLFQMGSIQMAGYCWWSVILLFSDCRKRRC